MSGFGQKAAWIVAILGTSALAGCGTPGEGGSTLGNMVLFGGTTVPPAAKSVIEDVFCPPVEISEGGSAIQAFSGGRVGDAAGLRSQIALGETARECVGQADGSTIVKIGVQGRALLGSGGSAGRYDVPVHIVVKTPTRTIANINRRLSVAIPSGELQGTFSVVEEGILVPASEASIFEIEVGLGGGGAQKPAARRRR
ncbi:hypothetical protein [Microvirga antarctica]|uniref:hypothetical protein n=1 Tax=Microvirga antarctica TaxID=2819233 RepID=UPI001B315791|nr:hypothetical protein [Microvirga antarctica]